jgi:hypothetical protein
MLRAGAANRHNTLLDALAVAVYAPDAAGEEETLECFR